MKKRYRDEAGRLTVRLDELKRLTRAEAADYYRIGKLYRFQGVEYGLMSVDRDGVAHFETFDGRELLIDFDGLGSFLPDVASDGMEIERL